MGISRLLAKAWIVTCLFAGGHAAAAALLSGGNPRAVLPPLAIALALFATLGLLFVCGYGVSSRALQARVMALFKPQGEAIRRPLFNGFVFLVFVTAIFAVQILGQHLRLAGPVVDGLERAIAYAVPGQDVLAGRLSQCHLEGGRSFVFALSWFLGFVYAASAISRLKQTADVIRADCRRHPAGLTPSQLSGVLGIAAVTGAHFLFMGPPLTEISCEAFGGLPGYLLIGLGPLSLGYVVFAAFAAVAASGKAD